MVRTYISWKIADLKKKSSGAETAEEDEDEWVDENTEEKNMNRGTSEAEQTLDNRIYQNENGDAERSRNGSAVSESEFRRTDYSIAGSTPWSFGWYQKA